jgi:hypothetical protein
MLNLLNLLRLSWGIFGALGSIDDVTLRLFEFELSFFKKTIVHGNVFSPLTWWVNHEKKFLNINFTSNMKIHGLYWFTN